MIKLDYYLSPEDIAWSSRDVWDLKNADEIVFTNNVFQARQTILINGTDFTFDFHLVWFVWEMTRGIADLADGAPEFIFRDTESGFVIVFTRSSGDMVSVCANYRRNGEDVDIYSETTATVPLDELQSALRNYAERVWKGLCSQFPDLKENAWLVEHYPSAAGWIDCCGKSH